MPSASIKRFIASESFGGLLVMFAAALALLVDNSPLSSDCRSFFTRLHGTKKTDDIQQICFLNTKKTEVEAILCDYTELSTAYQNVARRRGHHCLSEVSASVLRHSLSGHPVDRTGTATPPVAISTPHTTPMKFAPTTPFTHANLMVHTAAHSSRVNPRAFVAPSGLRNGYTADGDSDDGSFVLGPECSHTMHSTNRGGVVPDSDSEASSFELGPQHSFI